MGLPAVTGIRFEGWRFLRLRSQLLWRVGKAGILDGEIGVWLASVTDAALSLAHLQYDLSTSRFGSRARGCCFGGEIGAAAGARRAA